MKIALLSDIHSNKTALDAVIEDANDVDEFVCIGDVVGYGPNPSECVEFIRDNNIPTVQGNHDRSVNNPGDYANHMAREGLYYSQKYLSDEQINWLLDLPLEIKYDGVWIKHEHPDNDYIGYRESYVYPKSFPEMNSYLKDEENIECLVMGHTHIQGLYSGPNGIVCNPGSVGQPRDNDKRAAYAVYDTESKSVDLRRVKYDIEKVVEEVRNSSLPNTNGERLL